MTSDARWRDLYSGVEELLGTERADTFMSRISLLPIEELAKRSDIDALARRSDLRFEEMERRFTQIDQRLEQVDDRFRQGDQRFGQVDQRFQQIDRGFDKVDHELAGLNDRLDRFHLTLIGGLMAVIAAIIIQTIFG